MRECVRLFSWARGVRLGDMCVRRYEAGVVHQVECIGVAGAIPAAQKGFLHLRVLVSDRSVNAGARDSGSCEMGYDSGATTGPARKNLMARGLSQVPVRRFLHFFAIHQGLI